MKTTNDSLPLLRLVSPDARPLLFQKPLPARERCIVKLGEPYAMYECGAATEYRSDGAGYAGWYHKDKTITDHHAVPGSWI